MSQLTPAVIQKLTALLEPFLQTQNERLMRLDLVFAGARSRPDIDVSGATRDFTRRLIFRLQHFGEIEPGKPAL